MIPVSDKEEEKIFLEDQQEKRNVTGNEAEGVSASEPGLFGAAFWVVVSSATGSNFNCGSFCEGLLRGGTKLLASGSLGTGTGLDLSSGTRASGAILTGLRNCLFRFVTFLEPSTCIL